MINKANLKKLGIIIGVILSIGIIIQTYHMKIFNSKIIIDEGNVPRYETLFYILTSVALIISIACICAFKNCDDKNIHKKYFISAMLIGICYIGMIPLFAQSDEVPHYIKTYNIAINGNAFQQTRLKDIDSVVKKSIETFGNDHKRTYDVTGKISQYKAKGKLVEAYYMQTNYSVTSYLPLIVGLKIGDIVGLNPYFSGLLAKFLSLLFYVSLITLGIKLLPKGKFFAAMIFLSPVALQYMAAFSSDASVYTYFFVLLSYVLYIRENKKKLKTMGLISILILSLLIGLSKTVYVPLVLVVFLIPRKSFSKKKVLGILIPILIVISAIAMDYFYMKLPAIANNTLDKSKFITEEKNGDVIYDPIKIVTVTVSTLINGGYDQINNTFAGDYLCHRNCKQGDLIPFLYIVIYVLAYFADEIGYKIKKLGKAFYALVGIGVYLLIATGMYVYNYNPDNGTDWISGIQGRYLFPILLLVLLFNNKKININKKYIIVGNVFLSFLMMMTLIKSFIV